MLKCPRCERGVVRRSHRHGLLEHLYSLFSIFPFRCQLCTHRFLARPDRQRPSRHREYDRVPVRFPVSFYSSYVGEKIRGEGTLVSLSIRGCSLTTAELVRKGAFLRLQVLFLDDDPPIEIGIALVRSLHGGRLGLEFLSIRPEEQVRLRRLMTHLLYGRQR